MKSRDNYQHYRLDKFSDKMKDMEDYYNHWGKYKDDDKK
jgi:hypothetical protein